MQKFQLEPYLKPKNSHKNYNGKEFFMTKYNALELAEKMKELQDRNKKFLKAYNESKDEETKEFIQKIWRENEIILGQVYAALNIEVEFEFILPKKEL